MSSPEEIAGLYKRLLFRNPDPGGLDYFSRSGLTLTEVAERIRASVEYQQKNLPRVILAEPPVSFAKLQDCFWYHTMDLPDVGTVPGVWDLRGRFVEYIGGTVCAGKRVLDLGTASGFLTFEAEKRGAAQVLSFDLDSAARQDLLPFAESATYYDRAGWVEEMDRSGYVPRLKNGYWLAHRAFKSRARVFYGDIYRLPTGLGQFDVVIFGCVLEHLSNLVAAMTRAAELCIDTLVITDFMDARDEPAALLACRVDTPENCYTWWKLTLGFHREVLGMLGFRIASVSEAPYSFNGALGPSTSLHTIVAKRVKPLRWPPPLR